MSRFRQMMASVFFSLDINFRTAWKWVWGFAGKLMKFQRKGLTSLLLGTIIKYQGLMVVISMDAPHQAFSHISEPRWIQRLYHTGRRNEQPLLLKSTEWQEERNISLFFRLQLLQFIGIYFFQTFKKRRDLKNEMAQRGLLIFYVHMPRYILAFGFYFLQSNFKAGINICSSIAFQQHFTLLGQQTLCILVFEKALAYEFTYKYE